MQGQKKYLSETKDRNRLLATKEIFYKPLVEYSLIIVPHICLALDFVDYNIIKIYYHYT